MSIFGKIEHEVGVIFGDVKEAEQVVVLEIGKFKTYIAAHPALEQDLQLFFGKAANLLGVALGAAKDKAEADAAAGIPVTTAANDVFGVLHGAIPGVVTQLETDGSKNAFAVALQAATAIANAFTATQPVAPATPPTGG